MAWRHQENLAASPGAPLHFLLLFTPRRLRARPASSTAAMSSAAGTPLDGGGDRPWQSYHTAYTNAKAGMEGVDKEKVQKVIYEMSKGSKYFENEQKKEAITKLKIKHLRAQCAKLTDNDISHFQKHLQVLQPGSSLSPTHTTWLKNLSAMEERRSTRSRGATPYSTFFFLTNRSCGGSWAEEQQQYGQRSSTGGGEAATVWAEELHRRGRSSSSMGRGAPPAGARAGKKEQHGLAREIEEDELEIKEEARELLVHRIVEAVSGEARRGSWPGGIAAAHARRIAAMRNCSGARAELKEYVLELEEDAPELEEDVRELEEDVSGGSGDARR